MHHSAFATAAGTAHPAADVIASRLQLADATIDRAARQPARRRSRRDPTIALRHRLVGGEQPSAALVEKVRRSLPALPDVVDVDHPFRLAS